MELNLLALETSSSRCGVALLRAADGRLDVTVREHEGSQEHAERLLPMAGELLAEAGLAPARCTPWRSARGRAGSPACGWPGVAQGMALGLDIPVLPVVSHLAVAAQTGAAPGQPCWWRWTPA